jgi:hypothetical protein
MHFLVQSGPICPDEIRISIKGSLGAALRRLESGGMISRRGSLVRPREMRDLLAVRDVVAIEAKIGKWKAALLQAIRNTWFASESYVLLPALPRNPEAFDIAARFGIGIWTLGTRGMPVRHLASVRRVLPRSYGSWLFNESLHPDRTGRLP